LKGFWDSNDGLSTFGLMPQRFEYAFVQILCCIKPLIIYLIIYSFIHSFIYSMCVLIFSGVQDSPRAATRRRSGVCDRSTRGQIAGQETPQNFSLRQGQKSVCSIQFNSTSLLSNKKSYALITALKIEQELEKIYEEANKWINNV
jgi:hypothetical protein